MKSLPLVSLLVAASAFAQAELTVSPVKGDLSKPDPAAALWKGVPSLEVSLLAQPMVAPRPAATTTDKVMVQAVHDGKYVAFRLTWQDSERSEAGPLGAFSDGAALQFPLKPSEVPPPVMMGAKDQPVHLFHWRAQYQRDVEKGKPQPKDLYPNATFDMYPMEYADPGTTKVDARAREQFSPGMAAGNPQSYAKSGVDEIYAEGFSTSSVQEGHQSAGKGEWKDGAWTLVITRPLAIEGGSSLQPGGKSHVAFAVWQGGKDEVGSRKSLTMMWTPVVLKK